VAGALVPSALTEAAGSSPRPSTTANRRRTWSRAAARGLGQRRRDERTGHGFPSPCVGASTRSPRHRRHAGHRSRAPSGAKHCPVLHHRRPRRLPLPQRGTPAPGTRSSSAARSRHRVTVMSADDVPPSRSTRASTSRRQHQRDHRGTGYLTTRDGTTLSVSVVLPVPADQGPYPAVRRVLGLRPVEPDDQPAAVQAPRAGARHGLGRREHARHRLLGWRVQLLREPAVARRLRRDRDGRRAGRGPPVASGWWASRSRASASCSSPVPSRRTSPGSRRLSVIDDTWRGTLYPGGIYNDGSPRVGRRSGSTRTSGRTPTRRRG